MGSIPKFSSCDDGVNWFKSHNEYKVRLPTYYPVPGTIIFFDWEQDGNIDHVGIVKSVDIENNKIHTIEGNSGDAVKERTYDINDVEIMGYGFY